MSTPLNTFNLAQNLLRRVLLESWEVIEPLWCFANIFIKWIEKDRLHQLSIATVCGGGTFTM